MEFSCLSIKSMWAFNCEYKTYSAESVHSCKAWNYENFFFHFRDVFKILLPDFKSYILSKINQNKLRASLNLGFPGGSDSKASVYNAGDPGSIPGLGRSTEEGNGSPLQYSCLENPMDSGAWQATFHRVAKSRTQLSDFTFTFTFQVKINLIYCISFTQTHRTQFAVGYFRDEFT